MRKLHLVGLTTDRDGLIFTARKGSKSGGFVVPLDDRVRTAIAEASGAFDGGPADGTLIREGVEVVPKRLRSESALTPREMQARLRAGRSIDGVASEAGVDTEWVARFAVPILAEQAQVVELARNLVYAKPRLGESSQVLGASVLQNLSDRGVFLPDDVANAGWSAFQLHDSVWMVRFRYRSRGRDQEAQWEIDVPTGRLRARNRQASDLGYVGPDRWRAAEPDDTLPDDDAPAPSPRPARASAKSGPPAKAVAPARVVPSRLPPAGKATTRPAKGPATRRPAAAVPPARAAKARSTPVKARTAVAANAIPAGKAPVTKKSAASRPTRPAKIATASKPAPPSKAPKPNAASKTVPAIKAAARGRLARTTGPAKAVTAKRAATPDRTAGANRTVKAASAGTKGSPRTASARSPAKRTAKAVPAPEAGPAAGSGSVRMAVARVSTARVAASMAMVDREPWAAAVRRPPRPGPQPPDGRVDPRPALQRPAPRSEPERPGWGADAQGTGDAARRNAFAPRPLPAPGHEPALPRVRKVTVPRPPRAHDEPPPVTLPAPRRTAPAQEAAPVDRPKRRRLRSR